MSQLTQANRPLPLHPAMVPPSLYRPFFITGILVIMTVGAAWGSYLLVQIARSGSFTDVSIYAVNAHGHAQVFGWVALFVMGFAYQAFPRIWNSQLVAPHVALVAFMLMLIGLLARTGSMWAAPTWGIADAVALFGGILQIVAAVMFATQIVATFARCGEPVSPAFAFIAAALFWFVAMTIMALWHSMMLIGAPTREALLTQIATYQGALRDMQIHGFALCMILGVSMRFFPNMFGIPKTSDVRGWIGLGLILFAVISEITLLIISQQTGNMAYAGATIVPWLMLATGVAIIVLPWRLWRPLPKLDRSGKFVRTAYLWLGISLLLLLALPAYTLVNDMAFSHAYYGAVRHAITVGFISMMIMGVAARVVPSLNGIDSRSLSALWGPFLLVNIGCVLRVSTQIATDWIDGAYLLLGFSGVMELAGFGWWGSGLVIIMWRGWRGLMPAPDVPMQPEQSDQPRLAARECEVALDPAWTIQQIAERYPALQPGLVRLGLDTCCSAERTIEEIAVQRGTEPDCIVRALLHEETSGVSRTPQRACGCNGEHAT